ncbi:MAG: glycosyl hydrolase family 18 protein [Clostridia bacterium]|nr:glycosyl hydrolase family 18 protein [Clostridia bacterium]
MIRDRKKKRKAGVLIKILIPVILLIILAVCFLVKRYAPTGKTMSLYEYFDVSEGSSDVIIILNNERSEYTGIKENDVVYVPQELVQSELNQRFYWDEETGGVLYTDGSSIFTFIADSKEYTDDSGNVHSAQRPVMINKDGQNYMDMEYVGEYSDMDYNVYGAPSRVVITSGNAVNSYVAALKDVKVRYRGGVKSPVLEEVNKEDKLIYRKNVDEWTEVQTASGVVGYVKANTLSEGYEETRESTYTDNITSIKKDYKISLVWFQVGGAGGNNDIDNLLAGTSGITTISPTWYSITDNDGNMSCFATADFVKSMHARGLEVWPLVNDFTQGLDSSVLFGSKAARSKIINTLMSDAVKYGYDGINIDFEKISKEGGPDFLQFIRELSVQCRRKNIVLSIDNYKAEVYNLHYDMKEQGAFADYVILMGYDEHYAGSESGSVASIGFVEDGIKKALAYVPKEKLINGMPFYTRIWTEKDGVTSSTAVGMQSAINDLNQNGAPAIWDETVGQYFGSYEKKGQTVKIWVEEDRSIEEKLKLYQKYDLAGVAGWKLGLEKKSVWSVISKYVK